MSWPIGKKVEGGKRLLEREDGNGRVDAHVIEKATKEEGSIVEEGGEMGAKVVMTMGSRDSHRQANIILASCPALALATGSARRQRCARWRRPRRPSWRCGRSLEGGRDQRHRSDRKDALPRATLRANAKLHEKGLDLRGLASVLDGERLCSLLPKEESLLGGEVESDGVRGGVRGGHREKVMGVLVGVILARGTGARNGRL